MQSPASPGAIPLGALDLGISGTLVLLAGLVSLALRLRLEARLALAAARTVVQLLLVGMVLELVFRTSHLLAILGIALVMILAASQSAVARSDRTFRGALPRSFVTLLLCGLVTTWTVTALVIRADPWYSPRYLIPLLGMVLGNGLTGISLCLDQLLETLADRRDQIEMELGHGATSWEAARDPVAGAVRRGMIPIVNSMMVVGIVSLPGMMTGQILAGADPIEAVKYQIMVMFMIAGATSLGCILVALLVYRRLFNRRHQLEASRILRREH